VASGARHARAQSMPSTPAYGSKNVHFKEKDDGLESVRVFRRTGKPVSVSKPTSDTETETEPEPSAYPFPRISSSLSEIANCSPVPAPNPSPYASVHLESVTLPPARPPVLRGTVLVRNIAFEKHVGVRFTLDDWTTVSEVLATFSGSVAPLETLAGAHQGKTVGDLIGSLASGWDRFNFAIKLEDYETYLWQRTVYLVVRYSAPGVGEWWDNNSGENYRVTFRPHSGPVQPERRRMTVPSTTPFLLSAVPSSPLASRVSAHDDPQPTFSPPLRPPSIPRSASSPIPTSTMAGLRLNLRHYAAPTPPPRSPVPIDAPRPQPPSEASPGLLGGQLAAPSPLEVHTSPEKGLISEKDEVDEGFATGSEDGDNAETRLDTRPQLSLQISPPTPVTVRHVSPVSPTPSPPPRQQGPFSPIREPFSPRPGGGPGDSTYATLIREWCFAQGSDSFGTGATIGAQSAVPWVGSLG
jgi:Carbohydrate/starch-binding module (family 21)